MPEARISPGHRRDLRKRIGLARRSLIRDTSNAFRFGSHGPRMCQYIEFEPGRVTCRDRLHTLADSARVYAFDFQTTATPIEDTPVHIRCRQRWERGLTWEQTGAYDALMHRIERNGSAEGCRTYSDVVARYERLDRLFETVQQEGHLRSTVELQQSHFRNSGDLYVHFNSQSLPVMGRHGAHRLAIAQILGVSIAPGCLGVVHPMALDFVRTHNANRCRLRVQEINGNHRKDDAIT